MKFEENLFGASIACPCFLGTPFMDLRAESWLVEEASDETRMPFNKALWCIYSCISLSNFPIFIKNPSGTTIVTWLKLNSMISFSMLISKSKQILTRVVSLGFARFLAHVERAYFIWILTDYGVAPWAKCFVKFIKDFLENLTNLLSFIKKFNFYFVRKTLCKNILFYFLLLSCWRSWRVDSVSSLYNVIASFLTLNINPNRKPFTPLWGNLIDRSFIWICISCLI